MLNDSIPQAIEAAVGRFGGIDDVLVNNAGRGLLGALEEISDSEARRCSTSTSSG
ncbi:hypothetical protein ACFWWB_35155 [Streptomyces sp. NPDC058690]|uniref:hypothetical protein n=1 Tax=Streptomyces sp. NPDC058690 TaxID=3346600 RepID=UPI003656D7B4